MSSIGDGFGPVILLVVGVLLFTLPFVFIYCGEKERNEKQTEHFMNKGRPYFDKTKKICTVTGVGCPVTNIYMTCADCRMASSSPVVMINKEDKIIDHCTYCGANFTKNQVKGNTITCEYCGKTHLIRKEE